MSAPNYAEIARQGYAARKLECPHPAGSDLAAAWEAGAMLGRLGQQVPRRLTAAAARALLARPPTQTKAPSHD